MHPEPKKLGELLVEARLLSPAQLQEALRYQRIAGGRMGSNLVTLGFISEDVLMDFLSQQTGVPRMDVRHLEVSPQVLERIPKRMAEQLNVLPVALKEPKSLVLAMADPSDLNAIDSARFASGLNIEPVVASHSGLKHAIVEQYRKLDILSGKTVDIGPATPKDGGLPVALDFGFGGMGAADPRSTFPGIPAVPQQAMPVPLTPKEFPRDPFFDTFGQKHSPAAAPLFAGDPPDPPTSPKIVPEAPMVVHDRASSAQRAPRLDNYQTRTIVMGLIRLLQRRGVLSEEELTRLIQNLLDTRELRETDRE